MYRLKYARYTAVCFLLLLLLSASVFPAKINAQPAQSLSGNAPVYNPDRMADRSVPPGVQSFAAGLISSLAAQPEFAHWSQSAAAFDPLGPGTHSWLVSLAAEGGNPVGYLIITATEDGGLALAEYGVGPNPLFNPARLEGAAYKQLKPLYGGPTLTQWRVLQTDGRTERYVEAGNGETLPDTDADWAGRTFALPSSASPVTAAQPLLPSSPVAAGQAFDPDDNLLWMAEKPLSVTQTLLSSSVPGHKKLVFFSSGASRTYAQSLPFNGYQLWTSASKPAAKPAAVYLRSESEGRTRYILLDTLSSAGQFLAWTGK